MLLRTYRLCPPLLAALLLALLLAACGGSRGTQPAGSTATSATPLAKPANPAFILATTTSTQDSGLLDVLIPLFEKQTGYQVKTLAVGSGEALKKGELGEADVLLVHSPDAEKKYMAAGYGSARTLVMHNDFVILGPAADPAGIRGDRSALDAMKRIAAGRVTFISRGDDSGTNALELKLWRQAGIVPQGQGWYVESGAGMGVTLNLASQRQAYTISDRATFLANRDHLQLGILVEKDGILLNIYHVIPVSPSRSSKINAAGAQAFARFLTDPATQQVIGSFGKERFGQALFFADAGKDESQLGGP